MNVSEEIKRLHELHQAGALTDEEFARAKERLLSAEAKAVSGCGSRFHKTAPGDAANGDLTSELSRLRRSRTDRWLGGVCGGIAQVSGVASWIWRLVFALFTISFGFGLAIYILLWIFVPEDELIGKDNEQ
ncbi:phage shock protein C (PspC) family protein [Pseudoduganella lurida]|uniref:Phage shock protein C (PspC) family protein n=1 Tax=Pseudoduganella lurida TaxID=1036180 RepID=A0A562RBE3_9BURK|nr:PspC domain-containing protein [Pseudoduganella lurida]TWI66389.1 phage shock protein C (PspC) family protein [Pseudoduganella lurida]